MIRGAIATRSRRPGLAAWLALTCSVVAPPSPILAQSRYTVEDNEGTIRDCSFVVDASSGMASDAESFRVRFYKCFNRSIRLEVDRLAGFAGVPQDVAIGGTTFDLWDIFSPLNIGVDVIEDDTNLADPAGNCFSMAEMDAFFNNNQDAPSADSGDWNVWAAFVDCDTGGVCGRMFRGASNERDGFAVFTNAITGWCAVTGATPCFNGNGCNQVGLFTNANQAILRTTAHELGHALNLCHNNGDDTCSDCGGTTVMNQSGRLAVGWGYGWSAASTNHINNSPNSCIQPGTSTSFGNCAQNLCTC